MRSGASPARGLPCRLQLVVIAGPDQGRSFTLAEGQAVVIGRGEKTGTKLKDPQYGWNCFWPSSAKVPQFGTLALNSIWHLALWHSASFGTWHFGTQLRLALGTLALSFVWHLALWHSALFGTWHFGTQLRLAFGTLALVK